jgi:hypothetical protein
VPACEGERVTEPPVNAKLVTGTGTSAGPPSTRPSDGAHPDPVVPQVLRLANALHGLTREQNRPTLTSLIEEAAERWKDTSVRVVIAGDIKRGKSSVLNALIARPGLLPVDADVATCVYLGVSHGETERIEVTRRDGPTADEERFPIRADQLVDYGSMLGSPTSRAGVVAIEVSLPHPLLARGLVLVDTPGVGGMTRGHKDITLASIRMADALLFTVSAQEPVLRSELEFLAEASERVDTVVFLLTKIDADAEWPRMLEEDRAKMADFARQLAERAARPDADEEVRTLARRFPRLIDAPFLPVSARIAERAQVRAAAGRTEQAAELIARSGFDDVVRMLERTVASRERVRLGNILNLCELVLARLESEERERLRVAEGDHRAVLDELAAQQARLEELAPRQAKWRQRFALDVQRIQTECNRLVARELSRMERHYRDHITAADKQVDPIMAALGDDLERSLQAAWLNLAGDLIRRLEKALDQLANEFSLDDVRLEFSGISSIDHLSELEVRDRADPEAGKASLLDDGIPLLTLGSAMGGMLAKTIGTGGAFLPGLIISAPIAIMRYKRRKATQVRQEYLRVVREVLASVRQEFVSELQLKLIESRVAIEEVIDDALTTRRRELEDRRKELTAIVKEDAARQRQRREEADEHLTTIIAHRSECARLRTELAD